MDALGVILALLIILVLARGDEDGEKPQIKTVYVTQPIPVVDPALLSKNRKSGHKPKRRYRWR